MNDTQPLREVTENTPIAYYQPIAITPALIKWVCGTIIAAFSYGLAAGWVFMPAKDTDVKELRTIVEMIRADQQAHNKSMEEFRTTLAGIRLAVEDVQQVSKRLQQRAGAQRKVN
jgi:hypothetical protein